MNNMLKNNKITQITIFTSPIAHIECSGADVDPLKQNTTLTLNDPWGKCTYSVS